MIGETGESVISLVDLLKKDALTDEGEIKKILGTWSTKQKTALKQQLNANSINSSSSGYDADPFQKMVMKVLINDFKINF